MRFVVRDINGGFGGLTDYRWTLQRTDGTAICQSVDGDDGYGFATEEEARSDIAKAKTSMKAARFAKVEVEA